MRRPVAELKNTYGIRHTLKPALSGEKKQRPVAAFGADFITGDERAGAVAPFALFAFAFEPDARWRIVVVATRSSSPPARIARLEAEVDAVSGVVGRGGAVPVTRVDAAGGEED